MPVTDSPLRYPGGKTQLTSLVVSVLRENDLLHGTYVEPFAGGAGVAWRLLLNGYMSEVWINDIDPAIYSFWASVLRHTDELCERIEHTTVTMQEWHTQRNIQESRRPRQIDLGFSTFFLNRTNRSGILKGGVIGGLQQKGKYLLDCRFNKPDLIRKIRRIASYKDQIKLTRFDAEVMLRSKLAQLPRRALINIDPPYYHQGPELYCSFYKHDDHSALAGVIKQLSPHWMLTYDNDPNVRALYSDLELRTASLRYTAQVKRDGSEILVLDPRLNVPELLNALLNGTEVINRCRRIQPATPPLR